LRDRVSPTGDLTLLQDAQQLRLHRARHLADLVEEDRPAARRLKEPALVPHGVGEGAALVPEEFPLEQALQERRAVHRDERFVAAGSGTMDAARDHLLPRSRLTLSTTVTDELPRSPSSPSRAAAAVHPRRAVLAPLALGGGPRPYCRCQRASPSRPRRCPPRGGPTSSAPPASRVEHRGAAPPRAAAIQLACPVAGR
jgi:hypothetical protein